MRFFRLDVLSPGGYVLKVFHTGELQGQEENQRVRSPDVFSISLFLKGPVRGTGKVVLATLTTWPVPDRELYLISCPALVVLALGLWPCAT